MQSIDRRWRRALLSVFFIGCLLISLPVHADLPGAALGKAGFGEQAQNAADAAYNALAGLATKGETVRGGSGPLINIALNSGELICNSWIIMIRLKIKELSLKTPQLDGDDLNKTLNAIRKLEELAATIEKECTQKGLIGTGGGDGGGVTAGGGTSATPGSEPPPKPKPKSAEEMADEICWRRCHDLYEKMTKAESWYERSNRRAQNERQKADALDSAQKSAEQSLKDAKQGLDQMTKKGAPKASGIPDAAQTKKMTDYSRRRNNLRDAIKDLEGSMKDLEGKVKKAKAEAKDWEDTAKKAKEEYEAAKKAYEDCVKKCRAEAAMAHPKTKGGGTGATKGGMDKSSKASVVIEDVRNTEGANPFDQGEVGHFQTGTGEPLSSPVPTPSTPPAVVTAPVPVAAPAPTPTPETPPGASPTPSAPAAAPTPPTVSVTPGSFEVSHSIGGTPCPQLLGTANISASNGASLTVSASSASPVLQVQASGSQVKVYFNCSVPGAGNYGGNVNVNISGPGISETRQIPAFISVQ